ncbi:MAG: hypothetical protein K9N06_09630 [Candidatus Cloacimonetes bacterium]|nr:hypothetical protein [Candidatus Cloacimonadota bacterium]
MILLFSVTFAALVVSYLADRQKTGKALKLAWKKFSAILPQFMTMLALLALFTTLVPLSRMSDLLQQHTNIWQLLLALALGSIIFVPGFIAFPLAAVLVKNGVPYYVVAAFTSSLMLVGFASLPVEITYFGKRSALWRNLVCLVISLLTALSVGVLYGEFR